jgi:SPP1 family predicted phage head-tail adaptor
MATQPLDDLGDYRHLVTLEAPGAATPDGSGGYAEVWQPLTPPTMAAAIDVATAGDQERLGSGTVLSTASHVVRMRYHPQITTKTRLTHAGRRFSVTAIRDPEERQRRLVLLCAEVIT